MKGSRRVITEEPPNERPKVAIDLDDDVSHISASFSESDSEVEEIINICPQRPPQRTKPNSKGKGRDHRGSYLFDILEELRSLIYLYPRRSLIIQWQHRNLRR